MSRAPIPGQTKTRLEAQLRPEECAQLHKAFLKDMGQMLLKVQDKRDVKLYLAYTPEGTKGMFADLIPSDFERFLQWGQDLGAKMEQVLGYAAQENEKQIVIGSDLPALQPRVLINAIDLLSEKDIILGPSQDGGYYLCGTKEPYSFLFDEMLWGQEGVLKATIERIKKRAELDYDLVASCEDIDFCYELLELEEKLHQSDEWEHFPKNTAQEIERLNISRDEALKSR